MAETLTPKPPFKDQLNANYKRGNLICLGLDPDLTKMPSCFDTKTAWPSEDVVWPFLKDIVDEIADKDPEKNPICAVKPNIAFFEGLPDNGLDVLQRLVWHIHKEFPHIPVIGDVKRADISNTNSGYAKAAYDRFGFDAITTNPYFGGDTFGPFLNYKDKGLIILCKTSNPGSKELQDLPVDHVEAKNDGLITQEECEEIEDLLEGEMPRVYQMVAFMAARRWNQSGNLGLVVGATHPEAFIPVRKLAGNMTILVPGVGTQGGDLEKTVLYAPDENGENVLINAGSKVLYASKGKDFAQAAKKEFMNLQEQITNFRSRAA